jgi:NCS1 nucleoside transporter family
MVRDVEKQQQASVSQHGIPEELITEAPTRLQRPLTSNEKIAATTFDFHYRDGSSSTHEHDGVAPIVGTAETGIFARLRQFEELLDRKLGIEADAIDRKLPHERKPVSWHSQLNMAFIWASSTMNISCFATGFLGWQFGLSLTQSALITVFASLLGGAVSGFCATMGPATGLRQISIGRYSMGWYPNKFVAALNTIQQLGWGAVGCITGGLALTAVSDGGISMIPGIVIIAVCSLVVSFVGLRAILVYEKYAWLVYLTIFLIIFGQTGPSADSRAPSSLTGLDLSGSALSFFAIVYGSSASWATIASDYYVHYAVDVSRTKVFLLTSLGIALPTSTGMLAGCVVSSALNTRPDWNAAYSSRGLGFLIQTMLHPTGFANFLLVLLVLSGINMNIMNTYSAALSCQQFARPFARVPRVLWTVACFAVVIALALAGRDRLATYLQNFLSLLGYWCTSYFVIVFSEHYVFRRGQFANYDLDAWDDPARLPRGYAAGAAFALGAVAWVLGMVQTWFVGPVGRTIGAAGGDVGNEMTFVVTAVSFVPLRWLEYRFVGR